MNTKYGLILQEEESQAKNYFLPFCGSSAAKLFYCPEYGIKRLPAVANKIKRFSAIAEKCVVFCSGKDLLPLVQ